MKKFLPTLVLLSALAVLIAPLAISAQVEPAEVTKCTLTRDFSGWTKVKCPALGADGKIDCLFTDAVNDCPTCCLLNTIYTVTDWIFVVLITLAGIFIIWGGVLIIWGGGAPEKVTAGRQNIIWAIIVILIGILAKAIPAIVKAILKLG